MAEFRTGIVCESVREEISGQTSLVGIYSSNLTVPSFPAPALLTFWFELIPDKIGDLELTLEIELPNESGKKPKAIVHAEINALDPTPIHTPSLTLIFSHEGDLVLRVREEGGEFVELLRKPIMLDRHPY